MAGVAQAQPRNWSAQITVKSRRAVSASVSIPTDDERARAGLRFEPEDSHFQAGITYGLPLDREIERLSLRQAEVSLERARRDYDRFRDDIAVAVETIRSVLDAEDRVLKDPEYVVAVSELGDSSVNLVVRPWCKAPDYWGLRFDLTRTLKERLEAAGCSIPYPQQDVHLHKVE